MLRRIADYSNALALTATPLFEALANLCSALDEVRENNRLITIQMERSKR
jgi:hypothetical protein